MAEIVNLRRARKARARADKEAQAAENRLRFGASASERRTNAGERQKAERHLDGHRRDGAPAPRVDGQSGGGPSENGRPE